jgi:uncharacterized protein YndB with AHSA1/START domain
LSTTTAVFRVTIKGSVDAVWRELTKQDEPQAAVFNACLHAQALVAGRSMQMRTANGKNVMVIGKITRFEPKTCFAHTLRFTQYDDPECEVTYLLRPTDAGIECTLTIDRMPVGTRTAKDMQSGGKMIVDTLKAMVETGRPALGVRIMYTMFGVLGFVLPKRTRTENWPLN